jgi:glycerophosphoryl diester phosphodiesterase
MNKLLIANLVLLLTGPCLGAIGQHGPEQRLNEMFDARQGEVYVAAHRGDWRDAPENSIPAMRDAERMGVDIVELDLKKTSDGQLVVMHDKSLDRTTTGSGAVSDHTLAEIERLKLRAGTGHPTAYSVPTFAEELAAAKGRVILDLDQGWDYFPDVLREIRAHGMTDQVIFNARPNTRYDEFVKRGGPVPEDVPLMIVVSIGRPDAEAIIHSYKAHPRTIVQCIFGDDRLVSVQHISAYRKESPVWVNSLWPEQDGGHDDDRAVDRGEEDQTWGWLIKRGVNILQTDRPRELLEYLRQRALRGR